MKAVVRFFFFFFGVVLCSQVHAQSTVREVFYLQPGDSLEYVSYYLTGSLNPCQEQGYFFVVYLSRQDGPDSVSYTRSSTGTAMYFPPCSNLQASPGSFSSAVTYTHLDSPLFYYHTHAQGCDTGQNCYIDTSYIDTASFHGRRISKHSEGSADVYSYDTSFAVGLGVVEGVFGSENNLLAQGGFTLIYYHLISGEVWGTPDYFYPSGIGTVSGDVAVSVSPDPVTDVFRLTVGDGAWLPAAFTVYDAAGRMVLKKTISSLSTEMQRDGIANGLYFWCLSGGVGERSYGKMVLK